MAERLVHGAWRTAMVAHLVARPGVVSARVPDARRDLDVGAACEEVEEVRGGE